MNRLIAVTAAFLLGSCTPFISAKPSGYSLINSAQRNLISDEKEQLPNEVASIAARGQLDFRRQLTSLDPFLLV